ncbi:unnamed protein product [Dovyalis caffra]|uniref:Uncharacterized protein n=1 Tax=Dovyalis caffra TaxID=77055 RepID=A0AAV1RZ14_9ROSI|nr:unnamed protein product [Dovyalis caffra]
MGLLFFLVLGWSCKRKGTRSHDSGNDKALAAADGFNHGEVIYLTLPLSEGDGVISNMNSCSSVAGMLPAESFVGKDIELKRMEIENVDVAKAKEQEATLVEAVKALTADGAVNSAGVTISCGSTADMMQVESSATKETERKRIEKESVIRRLSGYQGFATAPAETFMMNEMKTDMVEISLLLVDRANEEMQADAKNGTDREPVKIADNIVFCQLLVIWHDNAEAEKAEAMIPLWEFRSHWEGM